MNPDAGTDVATDLRDLALLVARDAVALARRMRDGGIAVADTKSSVVDVVTAADRACEELIRSRILAARPDDAIMGEEGEDHPGTSGVRWIVDPIDGTVNYLYGLPDWAVSIAAEVDGAVVAGVVVNGSSGAEYAAARGAGATCDGRPIAVRPSPPLAERLVLTGFGYRSDVRAHQAACVAALLPHVRDIRRMGSCALDLCHIADGSGDAYVEEGPNPWDHSAGGLVLTEAGGRFGLLPGRLREIVPEAAVEALVVGAPADGWDTFVAALGRAGFLA
ncbi:MULTISPECIES: inositol monophosphatase family protein [Nocardioides]|uniref:inositol monophosphatase family protein n=1 Tax=Nocardioides TaxID=1839 RepID=UPI00032EBBA8|nr:MULTISPECIES: inositol monophosphatase family protein [Nocardioides]EON23740.1 inositol-phosphate phosphatase [Nocardioides sp. CF8]